MAVANTPRAKTERLMNLVMCLLATRRALPKSRLRQVVPQYAEAPSDEAFDRMFERDKDELRELGIPLVTEDLDSFFDDEPGYRIHQRDYALPDLTFAPDELAVLGLAGRAWAHAAQSGAASQAVQKLSATIASDGPGDGVAQPTIEPQLRATEPAFEATKAAVLAQQPIAFSYRSGSAEGGPSERRVEPWRLTSWRGRWYLSGRDMDKDAPRVYRLSRVLTTPVPVGTAGGYEVPADHEPLEDIRRREPDVEARRAVLLVRPGTGHALRRRAVPDTDPGTAGADRDRVSVEIHSLRDAAEEIATYGADVVVESPADLRDVVVDLLRGARDAHLEELDA
ncbi:MULTISPECIES: helix-turn-helix transcriptional regulator [unclassified Janibacter]|uniref:helix-turn-helix transcriptional regulator n=1 Tax=unclassified Janibacter TaxID=2649294 RepID=UPI003D06CE6C